MNLKTLVYIVVGIAVFLGIWLINILSGVALMFGFGLGFLLHNYFDNMFKNLQRNIYLTQKLDMEKRKRDLEVELEKIKNEGIQ